jgi:hypothetical protein
VNEDGIARFFQTVGESWDLEPVETVLLQEGEQDIRERGLRFLERGHIVKDFWQDEVEERPKLCQVILRTM